MKTFLFAILFFCSLFAISQENIQKTHYKIINEQFEYTLNYEKALQHAQLDNLRYLNSRRLIPVEGTSISIELFSAQELLEKYGKPISPLTIKNQTDTENIKFKLSENNYTLLVTPAKELNTNKEFLLNKFSKKNIITTFGGFIYDAGGLNKNYDNNESYIQTIYSDNGEKPYLNFTSFSVENNFDILCVYDGPDASSKLIGSYSGGNYPKTVQASGSYLTLVFTSDGSKTSSGWSAWVGRGTPNPPSVLSAPTCAQADPFCSGTNYNFPATTGSTTGEIGPNYGCLGSEPNPAWYYLQIANSGPLTLSIGGSAGQDVDFICWGPYSSLTNVCSVLTGTCSCDHCSCNSGAASGNIVDCSYSISATETCTIANAISGQYYMVMITNYSNQTQNIELSQTGGTGSTNCNIVNCGVTASNTGPYCVGQTIILNAATTNTTATTYAWTGPNSFSVNGPNVTIPNATLAMAGTYSVTGTTSGTVTCVAVTSVAVSANTPPVVNSPTICVGGTATLTASGSTTYTWSTTDTTATINVSPLATTVYTVTGSVGTCTASNTSTVTVVPNPTVTVNSGSVCGGASATLTATGATLYNWSPTTGLSPTTGSVVTASPATTTVYTVSGTVGTCSATPVTSTVTIFPSATVTATSNTMCAGGSCSISAAGATSYTWVPANTLNSANNPTVTATPSITTNYTVAGTDANGCIGIGTSTVTVYPLPVFTVSAPPVCVGQTLFINATNGYNYSLNSTPPISNISPPVIIPNASLAMSGVYIITATDAHTCNSSSTVQVVVNSPPTITAAASAVCVSATGTLTASGAGATGTYTWSPTTNLSPTMGSEVFITPPSTASLVYTVTGQDANGCQNSASITVTPTPPPIVSILPDTVKGCAPQCTITYSATSSPTANAYNWNFGSGQTSTNQNPNPCFKTAGKQVIKLTVTDINGCVNTATATVIVYPVPVPDFDYAPKPVTILTPDVHFTNLSNNTGGGNTMYTWNFGDTLTLADTSNLDNPIYTYSNAGLYDVSLVATSANGCKDTMTSLIIVEPDYALYVPNAFSPNGDGKNEIFKATGEGISTFTMYVFDRWGNNIFTTNNMEIGWNGSRNNKGSEALQQDVYVWKIELQSVNHQGKSYSGTVTLLR